MGRGGAWCAGSDLLAVVDEHDAQVTRDEGEQGWCESFDLLVEQVLSADEGLGVSSAYLQDV